MLRYALLCFAIGLPMASAASSQTTTASSDATALANNLAGTGFNLISATLTSNTENGFFDGYSSSIGIDEGVVLTTGVLGCVDGVNNSASCSGSGNFSTLALTFTLDTTDLYFDYVFGSEEYNEYVNSSYNDAFSLILNGPGFTNYNLATVPGGGGPVTINNVNAGSNSSFYINNDTGLYPIELDGFTTVMTAFATGLTAGAEYSLAFNISDVGDSILDSAVFIQAGTVGTTPVSGVPEPATWAMMLIGFGGVGYSMRRRRRSSEALLPA